MRQWRTLVVLAVTLVLAAGCSRPVLRGHARPSKTKDQYLRIQRVAIFPFENYTDAKDADKVVDALLAPSIRDEEVFEEVEDTRFVRDVMKKLKITSTDILDKEVIRKLGEEMNVQGIIYGKLVAFGKGKEKDAAAQVTMDLSLLDPASGLVVWAGNVSAYGGLTMGKVFGVTEGKTDIEVARDAVRKLASSMADDVEDAREKERKGIVAGLKKEQEQEQARLTELKSRTGKLQEEIDKARAEAQRIKEAAEREAEAVKSGLELQKAALDAERGKTDMAQQEIEREKLQVEVERKKIEEELGRLEREKEALMRERQAAEEAVRKAQEAIREEPVAPPPVPDAAPGPVPAPAEGAAPAADAPAPGSSEGAQSR